MGFDSPPSVDFRACRTRQRLLGHAGLGLPSIRRGPVVTVYWESGLELLPVFIGLLLVLLVLAVVGQAVLARTTVFEWERGLEYASGRLVQVLAPGGLLALSPDLTGQQG